MGNKAAENQRRGISCHLVEEVAGEAGGKPKGAELWKTSRGKSSMAGYVPDGQLARHLRREAECGLQVLCCKKAFKIFKSRCCGV